MLVRKVSIAALLSLVTATLAVPQGNNPPQPGGGKPPAGARPPSGSAQPGFRSSPPGGTRTFVVPRTGTQPGLARPQPGVVAPALPSVIAPALPGGIASPQPGFAKPPAAAGQAAHQFTWRGRTFARVQAAPFVYPSGYAYQRWAVGATLPPLLLAPDYFYPDWDTLGLEPPPPYYQWVRYGPDLLLVNVTTGEVADTIYDVFE